MKIVCINPAVYDYLSASLLEGLVELGHDVITAQASPCGRHLDDVELRAAAEDADLVIVGSNAGVRSHLVQDIANPRKVFVDGGDQQDFGVTNNIRFKAVFKRELNRRFHDAASQFVFPLPFAAEKRYLSDAVVAKDLAVSFLANMHTNPWRHSIHQRLQNLKLQGVVSGTTNERAYSASQPKSAAIETPLYRQLLRRSRISVSVAGAGYDTARFWEILAARAMLMTQDLDIVIPHGFTDGLDCVTFRSLDEFEEKLMYYMNRPELVTQIAERGHQRLVAHHTSTARARQFLEVVAAHIERPGYCAQFLHPEIRAIEDVCVGRGLDVGCGSSKTTPECIGVDITPPFTSGSVDCEAGRMSVANVVTSGDDLTMFADDSLDFVVARHNLAHYHDPVRTLREWKRVLRPGGRIGVVVPDHDKVDTYALDPTHTCHFTRDSLAQLAQQVGELQVRKLDVCVPNWSLVGIFEKAAA
jgi:SAM-dependent methyltransferase